MDSGGELGRRAALLLARNDGSGCRIEPGLTPGEFARVEDKFGFEFADDHRAFLAAGLPVSLPPVPLPGVIHTYSAPWPDWRDGDDGVLRERLAWPVEGVLFDVEHNRFWAQDWGPRPEALADALAHARRALADVPVLVPVYGHRYLPSGRGSFGHPVLSMWQTDIIYYGLDLADWVHHEFGGPAPQGADSKWDPRATVAFWRDLL